MPDGQYSALLLPYLGSYGVSEPGPSYAELGLDQIWPLIKQCSRLRDEANRMLVDPDASIPLAEDRWRQIGGLFGSVGESLGIAAACEVEVKRNEIARAAEELPAAFMISHRFFAESEGQLALSVGHRLANLVARIVALRSDWRESLANDRVLGPVFANPLADARPSWLSLTGRAAHQLAGLSDGSGHRSVGKLTAALVNLVDSPEWRNLDAQRGADFHRWRLESSVMLGVDERSGFVTELHDPNGNPIGRAFGGEATEYSAASDLEARISTISSLALRKIIVTTADVADAWSDAVEPASFGQFHRRGEHFVQVISSAPWSEDECSCCQ